MDAPSYFLLASATTTRACSALGKLKGSVGTNVLRTSCTKMTTTQLSTSVARTVVASFDNRVSENFCFRKSASIRWLSHPVSA